MTHDIAKVRAALEECASELGEWVENHYKLNTQYPSERRRYQRDMEPVQHAREALAVLDRIEAAALERAARVAEEYAVLLAGHSEGSFAAEDIAIIIRALNEKPAESSAA